jgi:cytochrome c oxidase assembly protein subunit 15
MNDKTRKIIGIWLIIGLILVVGQIALGGITRLTDSGLSITEWNVVKGTLPPLNEEEWQLSFDKYQAFAKTQFESLHADMSLSEFKSIFFWEWFHRFWARMMGFIFLFPFLFFLYKKLLPSWLIKRLLVVVSLAALAATFGIIMVFSGLENENRTWVSAYKLLIHLGLAAILFSYLFKTCLYVLQTKTNDQHLVKYYKFSRWMIVLIFSQVLIGALMAGMRAGIIHMHFPFFLGNNALIEIILANTNFSFDSLIDYESNNFIKAVVQVFHRSFAWIIFSMSIYFFLKIRKETISNKLKIGNSIMLALILIQFTSGVFTIMNYANSSYLIPLGVLHQAFAFLLLISWVYISFQFKRKLP